MIGWLALAATVLPHAAHAQVAGMLSGSPAAGMALVIGTALVSFGILIGVIIAGTSRDEKARQVELEEAAAERRAAAAEAAELRFLTMLSHDLRTPLNGVMGLMALARQSGLSPRQERLLADADRVGSHLVHLLADLLDYAQLRTGSASLNPRPVETGKLLHLADRCLTERARQHRLEYSVTWSGEQPASVLCDEARLRQVVTHLCVYFVESVRCKEIEVAFSYQDERVLFSIRVPAGTTRTGAWRPDDLLKHPTDGDDPFASDAAGPMIVRGLTRLMTGKLKLMTDPEAGDVLTVSIPAPVCSSMRQLVRFELASDASALLLHKVLDEQAWQVWTPDMTSDGVSAVLFEGDGSEEHERLAALKTLHPGARFISLGQPWRLADFDAVCPAAPGAAALAVALSGRDDVRRAAG